MSGAAAGEAHACRFSQVLGVGGIGTGSIIALDGNETLGRTESRMGRLLEARDYCKLHIVEHYLAVLLGGAAGQCRVAAVGNVGSDDAGNRLLQEMGEAGIDTSRVRMESDYRTLFSVSFLYPDQSAGNLTISNSAASRLDVRQIEGCRRELAGAGSKGIALCLPEVPLQVRSEFLRMATACGNYRVGSFAAGEMEAVRELKLLARIDLLALNREEAAALGRRSTARDGEAEVLAGCQQTARAANPEIRLMVSAGADGVHVLDEGKWLHYPAVPATVVSSAGAGDALLGGVVAGLVQGLPLTGGDEGGGTAIELGLLVAAFSLASPHTIHPGFSVEALREFAEGQMQSHEGESARPAGGRPAEIPQ